MAAQSHSPASCGNIDCNSRPCFVLKLQHSISNNDAKLVRYLLEKSKLPESYDNLNIIDYVHDAIYKSCSRDKPLLYYSDCKGLEAANVFENYNNINIEYIRILFCNIDITITRGWHSIKWVLSGIYRIRKYTI